MYQTAKPQRTHAQDVVSCTAQHSTQSTTQPYIDVLTAQVTKLWVMEQQTGSVLPSKHNVERHKNAYPKISINSSNMEATESTRSVPRQSTANTTT
jgi:hypothetical protein